MPWQLIVGLLGTCALVFAILWLTFTLVGRSIAREAESLSGVVRDSGPVKVTTRYRKFRSAREYRGGGFKSAPGRVVLTHTHLLILQRPQRYGKFPRTELHRFTVGLADTGLLQLRSDDPPEASGSIDYRIRVGDAPAWVAALVGAGASPSDKGHNSSGRQGTGAYNNA